MSDVNLGSISTSVLLKIDQLEAAATKAEAAITEMADGIETAITEMSAKIEATFNAMSATMTANMTEMSTAVTASMEKMAAAAEASSSAMSAKMDKAGAAMKEIGSQLNDFGNKALMAGGAVAAGLNDTVEVAGHYDQALRDVSAVNKLTEDQFKSLHDEVLNLTNDPLITQGPTELAKGMYRVASAGFEGKAGLEVMREAAIGATAGMSDTATSSLALIAALKSYPAGTYTARQAMDLLVGEVDLGVNTFSELAGSIGRVLPIASQAGVGLDEVAAAIATMTRGGLKADEAVTYLTQLINHIIKPGKDAAKAMDELGIAHGLAAFQANGLKGVLDQLTEKTKSHQQAVVRIFPEIRAMGGAMILARNAGADFTDILEQERKKIEGAGAAHQVAAEQVKGFDDQTKKAAQQLEAMAIKIGEDLLPAARNIVNDVGHAASAIHNMSDENRAALVKMAEWGAIGALVLGVFAKITAGAIALSGRLAALQKAIITLRAGGLPETIGTAGIGALLAGGGLAANAYAHAAFDVHAPEAGDTNIPGGQVNTLERRRFLTSEIAKLEHSIQSAQSSGIVVVGAVMDRNKAQLADLKAQLAALPAAAKSGAAAFPGPPHTGGQPTGDVGTGTEKAATKAADDAAQSLKDLNKQMDDLAKRAYAITHTPADAQRHEALLQYREDYSSANGNPKGQQDALNIYTGTLKKIQQEEKKATEERLHTWLETSKKITEDSEKQEKTQVKAANETKNAGVALWDALAKGSALYTKAVEDSLTQQRADWLGFDQWVKQQHAIFTQAAEANLTRLRAQWLAFVEWVKQQNKTFEDQQKQKRDQTNKDRGDVAPEDWQKDFKSIMLQMKAQAEQTLVNDLGNDLTHGFHKFFQNLLQQWEQLLANMLAQAVVSGVFSLLSGGSFIGGALFGLTGGGFDDGANDLSANRWGRDFGTLFTRGVAEGARREGRSGTNGGNGNAGGNTHVEVHMHGDNNYSNGMDAKRVADQIGQHIAYHAQIRTRFVVGP